MAVWRRWIWDCDRASSGQAGQATTQGYAAELKNKYMCTRTHTHAHKIVNCLMGWTQWERLQSFLYLLKKPSKLFLKIHSIYLCKPCGTFNNVYCSSIFSVLKQLTCIVFTRLSTNLKVWKMHKAQLIHFCWNFQKTTDLHSVRD